MSNDANWISGLVVGFGTGIACATIVAFTSPDPHFFYNIWKTDIDSNSNFSIISFVLNKKLEACPTIGGRLGGKSVLDASGTIVEHRIVLPADIDRNGHMNNARYIYYLNFTRRRLFNSLGIWVICNQWETNMVVQAQSIRFRRELVIGQTYDIRTRIVAWHEAQHCFFIESVFISTNKITGDEFINAIHYVKYRLVNKNRGQQEQRDPETAVAMSDDSVVGRDGATGSSMNAAYTSPMFLLRTAQLLPPDFKVPNVGEYTFCSYSGAIVPPSEVGSGIVYVQDEEIEFLEHWERGNVACSEYLNPKKANV